jgi:hypothetical protein
MTADTNGGGAGLTTADSLGNEDSSDLSCNASFAIVGGKRNHGVDRSVDIRRVESEKMGIT